MAARRIYTSSSGDTWDLVRDPANGRVSVLHTANEASGGAKAEFDLDAFLPRSKGSAENLALQAMIGTLVDGHD